MHETSSQRHHADLVHCDCLEMIAVAVLVIAAASARDELATGGSVAPKAFATVGVTVTGEVGGFVVGVVGVVVAREYWMRPSVLHPAHVVCVLVLLERLLCQDLSRASFRLPAV